MVIIIFNIIGTDKLNVYILLVHEHSNVLANKNQNKKVQLMYSVSIEDSDW